MMLISIFVLSASLGAVLVVSSFIKLPVVAQNGQDEEKERQNEKVVTGGHGSGYGPINTSGDVLDSMNGDTMSPVIQIIDPCHWITLQMK